LKNAIDKAQSLVVASFKGLSASEVVDFRGRAKSMSPAVKIKVTQNRLAKIAFSGTKFEGLSPLFKGATLIAYSEDPVSSAKLVHLFAKANDKVAVLGGAMGDEILDVEGVMRIALLPTLDEARAKILAVLNTPAGNIARVFKAYSEKPLVAAA
jgi:large subunit ribosomal protein L10